MAKKLKSDLLLMCDFALTSNQGKLSIIGIFDRIFVHQIPAKYSRFFIVATISGEPGSKHSLGLNLVSPEGKKLLPEKPVEVTLSSNGKANLITDLANLVLAEVGEYQLTIYQDDKKLATTPFFVTKVQPQGDSQKQSN